MTALHELRPDIPITHQEWSHDDYAAEMIMYLGLARVAVLPDLSPPKQSLVYQRNSSPEEIVKSTLAEAIGVGLEWAGRNQWQIGTSFRLNLDWRRHGLAYMITRTTGGITQAHMYSVQDNPVRAMEFLNHAIAHIMDYSRARGWSLEEIVSERINNRNNGSSS